MKNIIKFFLAAVLGLALASCDEKGPDQPGGEDKKLNENIKLTVTVMKAEGVTANIRITSDGSDADTWYGFATTEKDVEKAISKKITEIVKDGKVTEKLLNKASHVDQLKDLEAKTAYTYIAFGLTEDGTRYGLPASATFETGNKKVDMVENPAWTVEYAGAGVINETEYDHTIKVTSTDKNKYFISAYDKETYELNDIFDVAQYELDYLKEWIAGYNEENKTSLTVNDMLFEGNGVDAMNLYPGDWYAIAIGVDDNGDLSGFYSATAFNIPEPEATEAYSSWLGKWTWTGENGLAWTVEFEHGINNMLYYMRGWEPTEDGNTAELTIPVMWDEENELWYIYTSNLGYYEFEDGIGAIYVLGAIGKDIYPIENLPICLGGMTEDGGRAAYGYEEEMEDGTVLTIEHMQYVAVLPDGYYLVSDTSEWPTFPIVITPYVEAGTASVSEVKDEYKSVMKFTKAPRLIKTYYQSYLNAIKR